MKKIVKIIILSLSVLIFTSCMNNNVDSTIPFNWILHVNDVDSEGNEIIVRAEYVNFGAGKGDDNVYATEDDGILKYNKIIKNSEYDVELNVDYDGPGEDGLWFTGDDRVLHYAEFGTKIPLYKFVKDPGEDKLWFTEDDVKSLLDTEYSIVKEDKIIHYISAGEDSESGTDDDVIGSYATINVNGDDTIYINYRDPGLDKIWFTNDDIVGPFEFLDKIGEPSGFNAQGNEIAYFNENIVETENSRTINHTYFTNGSDNIWFSDDDEIFYYESRKIVNKKVEEIIFIRGAGEDNILLTSDDESYNHYLIDCSDDITGLKSIKHTNTFGNDGVISSGDEIWTDFFTIETEKNNNILTIMTQEINILNVEKYIYSEKSKFLDLHNFCENVNGSNIGGSPSNGFYNFRDNESVYGEVVGADLISSFRFQFDEFTLDTWTNGRVFEVTESESRKLIEGYSVGLQLNRSYRINEVDFLKENLSDFSSEVYRYLDFSVEEIKIDSKVNLRINRHFNGGGGSNLKGKSTEIFVDKTIN